MKVEINELAKGRTWVFRKGKTSSLWWQTFRKRAPTSEPLASLAHNSSFVRLSSHTGRIWSKRILLPDMGSDARHQARPSSLAMLMKGRGSRSMRGSTSRKRETTTQYLSQES